MSELRRYGDAWQALPGLRWCLDPEAFHLGFLATAVLSVSLVGSPPYPRRVLEHGTEPALSATNAHTDAEPLLTPAEVASMFRVDPKTVTRWAKSGKLTSIRTLGGHRRYRETEVKALLAGIPQQREAQS
jgi:excisionase family DNA binding protein